MRDKAQRLIDLRAKATQGEWRPCLGSGMNIMTAIHVTNVGPICDFDCKWIADRTPDRDWRPDMNFTVEAADSAAEVAQGLIDALDRISELEEFYRAFVSAMESTHSEDALYRKGYCDIGKAILDGR